MRRSLRCVRSHPRRSSTFPQPSTPSSAAPVSCGRGVDVRSIRFATAFGRPLDYYTGMVFEMSDARGRVKWPIVAGGRYDMLLTRSARLSLRRRSLRRMDQRAGSDRGRQMSALVIGVPSKGRLQENANAFFSGRA